MSLDTDQNGRASVASALSAALSGDAATSVWQRVRVMLAVAVVLMAGTFGLAKALGTSSSPEATLASIAVDCHVPTKSYDDGSLVLDQRRMGLDGVPLTYEQHYACVLQALGAGDLYGEILGSGIGSRVVGPFFIDWHVDHSTNWHIMTVTPALSHTG